MAGIIDTDAMYRAGFASRNAGTKPANQARNAFWERVTDMAYNTIGDMAMGAVKDSFKNLQTFKNKTDSQTALLNLSVDKMPKDNEALKASITEIKKRYDAAAKKASLGFGKKRSQGRQDMALYMQQLTDMSSFLEVYKTGATKSQGMAKVLSGVAGENNKGEYKNINPGSSSIELNNTLEQANGLMGLNLRWDIDKGQMNILRGGEWSKDDDGKDIYLPKEGTAELRAAKYSDLRFASDEDNIMEDDIKKLRAKLVNDAWNSNAKPWELISGLEKDNFMGKVDSYSDAQFKDFYFGGFSYDYSTNRMDESAPAYIRLKGQYPEQLENDGSFKEGYGPGTKDWEGRLTILKEQSFVKGSSYRKEAAEDVWKVMETQYTDTQSEWGRANPSEINNKNNNNTEIYFGYTEVPIANSSGEKMQTDPSSAQKAYDYLNKKTAAWEGKQGYYVKVNAGPGKDQYIRYNSRNDYFKDKKTDLNKDKPGALSSNKLAWQKTFGKDALFGSDRYIDATRIAELEGAFPITKGKKKFD